MYDKGWHMIWHDCVGADVYDYCQAWINKRMNDSE